MNENSKNEEIKKRTGELHNYTNRNKKNRSGGYFMNRAINQDRARIKKYHAKRIKEGA
jgi:hypothetical protein